MNYKDSAGDWQPIDNTLVPSSVPGFAQENRANRYRLLLPQNIGTGPVRFQLGGNWVQFQPAGQSAVGAASGSKDTFTAPNAVFSYQSQNDGIKEAITLPTANSPASYTFTLQTSPGLTLRQGSSGRVDFLTSDGTTAFSFTPPFAQDATGAVGSVSMTLGGGPAGQTLTLSADSAWLSDPARRYPVVIDPSIAIGDANTTLNCWVQPTNISNSTSTGDCSGVDLTVSGPAKAFIRFDLSTIPTNAELLNADVGLNQLNSSGAAVTIGLYAMTRGWTSGATWTTYDGTHAWTAPGGDFQNAMSSTNTVNILGANPVCPQNVCEWGITALTQGWLNGTTPNFGVAVRDTSGSGTVSTDPATFFGSGWASLGPQLTVTYTSWTGDRRFFTETSQSLSDQLDVGANVANGNLLLHEHDTSIPGTGLDLSVDHYYNNLSATSGSFGNGWTMSTAPDVGLQIYSDGSVALQGPTGYQVPFIKGADGSFSPPSGIDSTLVLNGDGTYTLTEHASSETYKFTAGGFLTAHTDSSGNTIAFGYTNNLLSSITDTQGRRVSFTYASPVAANLISQMTDSAGRQYKYSYDSNKNLTTYIDPAGKSAVFGYDSSGNLNRITDPNGNVTAVAYDGYRRVLSIQRITNGTTTPPTGPATTFTYNVGNTVVTDANGHGTTYAYDAYGRTTQTTDPLGHSSQTTWNADSEVTQTVTPLGHPTTNTYDSNNNLTQTTDPVGATTSAQYTSPTTPYLPTTVTDAAGEPSTIQYNGQGLPTLIKDALNEQSSLGYNSNGTLSSQTDPNNNTVAYGYNGQGQLASVTPPAGTGLGTPSVTYNAYGLPATSVDGKGARTTYTYDQLGRTTATSTVSADGASTIAFGYSYDSDGNLLAMSDSSGATTYTYNALNQETSEHHPDGKTVSYTYDGVGNMLTMTDSGGTVKYTYDAMDRVKSVTDRQNKTTYFLYDADGNRTESDFPNGVAEQMVYDAAGQLTNISSFNSAHATLTSFGYVYTDSTGKEVGRVTLETASDGTTHTKAYDGAGRLIEERVTDANNTLLKDWKWRYDAAGNMIMLAGSYTQKTLTYNAANELTNAGPNTFTYDANGNELYNSGSGVTSTWDPVSRITTMTSANGTVIQYNYTDGSITEVRGPVAYEYGATGVSTITDASGNTTTITRLPDGTPISMTNATGTYFYLDDGQGNVAGVTGSSGQLDNSYSYDPMGNVTSQIGSVANPYTYGYEQYDPQMGVYYSEDGSYYDPSASQGQTSGSGLFFSDMEGEDPALTGGDASGADESGPGGLEFPESQINKVVKSAERMDHGQMRAVRKLNSHFGRGQPEYQGLKPNAKTALGIIRYVMEDPANWYDEGHYFDVYGQNGQGVRLLPDAHGDFTIFETFISWTHYLNKP